MSDLARHCGLRTSTLASWPMVLAAFLAPGVSRAQSSAAPTAVAPGDVRDLLRRGFEARRTGHDAEAIELFRAAYRVAPTPRTLVQIALCEQAMGQWVLAERDLVHALEATSDHWIAVNAGTLRESLTAIRSHLGSLEIVTNVQGAEIWIDGTLIAHTPLSEPLRVPLGDVRIELRAEGHHPVSRIARVEPNVLSRESIDLSTVATSESPSDAPSNRPIAVASPAPSDAPSAAPIVTASSAPPSSAPFVPIAPPAPRERASGASVFAGPAVVAATGVAAYVVAGVFYAVQLNAERDLRTTCAGFDNPATPDVIECAGYLHPEGAYAGLQTDVTIANVGIALGTGALLAAGGWLIGNLVRRPADRHGLSVGTARIATGAMGLEVRWP